MGNCQPATKPEEVAKVYQEVAKRAAEVLNNIAKKRPQLDAVRDELGIAKGVPGALCSHARRSDGAGHALYEYVARVRTAVAVELDEDAGPGHDADCRAR